MSKMSDSEKFPNLWEFYSSLNPLMANHLANTESDCIKKKVIEPKLVV